MDKISGILPRSARVKSVDLSDAPPVRPGAPSNGRSEGRNSIKDRFTVSEQAKDFALKETLAYKNPKESLRAKMVEDASKKFFETRLTSANERAASERLAESLPETVNVPSYDEVETVDVETSAPSTVVPE